jgi:hypothetical protein
MKEITPEGSAVPIYLVPLTEEQLAEHEQWAVEKVERQEVEEAKLAAKETAKNKLAALGLTEEEVSALIS